MKKITLLICIGLCCLSLTGCIDIVQHITRKSDGTEQNTISITATKAVIEMLASMQGNPSVNYDDLFAEFNTSDMEEYEQFGAKMTKINDQVNAGYLIDMNINYKDKDILKAINAEDIDLIPKYGKKKMTIYVGSLQDDDYSKTDNEMLQLFLASSKYRLLISKTCMPSIKRVLLKTAKKSTEVGYLDLYDEYMIDIPIILLLTDKATIEIYQ
ncbi:hypothetical protein JO41_08510 [Treponema sp. OMZ 838]|uniref:hypothetical protein n=1 Tax=Treponema sp. OMZ 838 TaxID=1539298 RepID=UPI0005301504|nr:hypothetical protein [Treponema sp. OMZ 838]AIW89824.1 hypothetical protein JO41_08510 [Treponema sp. OMZ 838]